MCQESLLQVSDGGEDAAVGREPHAPQRGSDSGLPYFQTCPIRAAAMMATKATNPARANGTANATAISVVLSVVPKAAMLMAKPAWRTIIVTAEAMPACVGGASAKTTLDICGFASAAPTPIVSIPAIVAARRRRRLEIRSHPPGRN